MMNKKGYSMSGWAETALFISLFMVLIGLLIINMNVKYGEDYSSTFGNPDRLSGVQDSLSDYQDTLQQNVKQGQSSSSGLGISLTTTWSIITSGATIMWTFLTGGFIEDMVGLINLPFIVGRILRILFVLSVGFIILKLVLRIKP